MLSSRKPLSGSSGLRYPCQPRCCSGRPRTSAPAETGCPPPRARGPRMPAYILLYRGPTGPEDASHEGWPEWFAKIGDSLIDIGSPMPNGDAVAAEGESRAALDLNG